MSFSSALMSDFLFGGITVNNYQPENPNNNPNEGTYSQQGEYPPYGQPGYQNPYGPEQPYYDQPYLDESGLFNENKMARLNGVSANIKLSDWLKADCLSFLNLIPGVGSIIAIVVYCILAFSSKTAKSLKTRYQASLIWSIVCLVLFILFFGFILAIAGAIVSEVNSEFGSNISNF